MRVYFLLLNVIFAGSACCIAQQNNESELLYFTNECNNQVRFIYSDTAENVFLRQLRRENGLQDLILDCKNDLERLYMVMNWTSSQWKHSGNNIPLKSDAITILKEAKEGGRFRCVEYAIVLSSALSSIGIKSRVLALKTKTVETMEYGAGHVLTEVYLREYEKWIMADPQFNLVPICENTPLNAVEFQNCIATGKEIKLCNINGAIKNITEILYMSFIPKYLYYFDIPFDNRQGLDLNKLKIEGMTKLMLVPIGSKNPVIFQITEKIDYCLYTNSIADFYRKP
jgi:hypothetical protein